MASLALGGHLIAPAHDEKRHHRRELPREVVIGVCKFGRLVRQNQYLASGIFLGRVVDSSCSNGIGFLQEPSLKTRSYNHKPHSKHG